jgi:hypothetical protein
MAEAQRMEFEKKRKQDMEKSLQRAAEKAKLQ